MVWTGETDIVSGFPEPSEKITLGSFGNVVHVLPCVINSWPGDPVVSRVICPELR